MEGSNLAETKSKSNWFKEHLNWTIIFTVCVQYAIALAGLRIEANTALYIHQSVIVWIALALSFPIFAWVLSQKGYSMWWLYLNFLPIIGWIVFMSLDKSEKVT
jgi:hypothetical protein